jgi:hypothetical protein
MSQTAAAQLIAVLTFAIAQLTGFSVPKTEPELRFLPAQELQFRFCGRPCPIHAFFPPGSTIYLERGLDVFHDRASESILVHELTHWMQQANARNPVAQSCQEWLDREYQAFDVQFRWLRDTSPNIRAFSIEMAKLGQHPLIVRCPAAEDSDSAAASDSVLAAAPRLPLRRKQAGLGG